MTIGRLLLSAACAAMLCAGAAGAAAPAASVPEELLEKIDGLFQFPGRPRSQEEYNALLPKFARQLEDVLVQGAEAEAKYPKADNLFLLRMRMLRAGSFLDEFRKTPEARKALLDVSRRILASDAPAEGKVTADYFVTADAVNARGGPVAANAEKQIRAFLARYGGAKVRALALVRAADLAGETGLKGLHGECLDALQKDYLNGPGIQEFLRRNGRNPPFAAELTLLDGRKLTLPGDLRGKVVVIDFWATWCGPCVAFIPHMREVYKKYKDKGVEVVGISLDEADSRDKLAAFVKDNEMPWLHAYSGKGWEDPTARQYGIGGIPSVWIVGRDGNVVTDRPFGEITDAKDQKDYFQRAGENFAKALEQALSAPTTKPAK